MDKSSLLTLQNEIKELEQRLAAKKRQLEELQITLANKIVDNTVTQKQLLRDGISNQSLPENKIALFRSLFKGREDVYAKRFESKKTGKAGYQPVCRNEWVRDICEKPKITCGSCTQRSFEPVTDEVIKCHLEGFILAKNEWGKPVPFVMGIYPLLQDETCNFLAVDFDKETWQEDTKAFLDTCKIEGIPAALERSRSGNGAHIWIFFDKPVPAVKARKLGSYLMTRTLDRRPEIGLDSFDRFIPKPRSVSCDGLRSRRLHRRDRERLHTCA